MTAAMGFLSAGLIAALPGIIAVLALRASRGAR
jgi:hypothetical protein